MVHFPTAACKILDVSPSMPSISETEATCPINLLPRDRGKREMQDPDVWVVDGIDTFRACTSSRALRSTTQAVASATACASNISKLIVETGLFSLGGEGNHNHFCRIASDVEEMPVLLELLRGLSRSWRGRHVLHGTENVITSCGCGVSFSDSTRWKNVS